jgi:hypothetical protein
MTDDPQPFLASWAADLGVALNEARLLAIQVDAQTATAAVWLEVLTLPPQGPEPEDRRRRLVLGRVSRVAVSYRDGRWDDPDASVLPLELADLSAVIGAFGQQPIYGWEFFNHGAEPFAKWQERVSVDVGLAGNGTHTLDLFQKDGQRILDVRTGLGPWRSLPQPASRWRWRGLSLVGAAGGMRCMPVTAAPAATASCRYDPSNSPVGSRTGGLPGVTTVTGRSGAGTSTPASGCGGCAGCRARPRR